MNDNMHAVMDINGLKIDLKIMTMIKTLNLIIISPSYHRIMKLWIKKPNLKYKKICIELFRR